MKLKRMLSGLLSLAMLTGAAAYSPARDAQAADGIVLADTNGAAAIYIDPDGSEYDGISLAADAAAGDIEAVTGQRPEVVYELPESGVVIIAGVVNEEIITNEGLTWEISASNEDIKSEDWERYQIQVKEEEDLTKVIVAGADKRGTVYGLFHITQDLCGVSPWVWWADVRPAHKDVLSFTAEELETVSIRPTVNYRGIFLNNEAPSLSAYVKDRFGNYNYLFYANVCELLLRLKANYLWPAMWGNVFPEEGVLDIDKAKDISNLDKLPESERDNLANERIAEDYGVVISFSHHEPMIRAGLEWQRLQGGGDPVYTKPTENGVPLNEWNYNYNADNIYDFWNDGIERSGGFDNNLITIGMRGEGDSALKNPDGSDMTLQQNVDVLKKAITDQKKILAEHGLADSPQMFAIYTEVQQYWYGYDAATNQSSDALRDWEPLKDDIIVLCDDNFGYTRFLTYPDEREDRNWGMYYHFDMNGGAFSYKWINTVPLERIWDSMTTSYDYGIDDLWVVNVGDLKPLEFPISYFIDMGYDFDKWGTNNPNSTDEYTKMWIEQQFGSMLDENEVSEVADIVTGYADMNGRCKPEIIFGSTFSTTKYNEAQDELRKALELEAQAEKYKAKFDGTPLESAYFELVYHPAAATATVNRMLIYKGFSDLYADQGSMLANTYAALTNEMVEKDKSLFDDYNALEGGKWNLMMNQKNHTCYTGWEDTSGSYPTVRFIEPAENGSLTVTVPDEAAAYTNGMTAQLPAFESTELQQYPITLSTTGGAKAYSVSADKEWIKFTGETSGSFDAGTTLGVYVDFEALSSSDSGKVTVSSGDETVTVEVTANIIDTSALADKTYTASNGNIVIDAQNYAQKGSAVDAEGRTAEWVELEKYGKWGSTMKTFPTTATFVKDTGNQTSEIIDKNNAPRMEYNIYVPEDGEYNIICCFGHSNNLLPDSRLRYGVSVDGGEPITVTRDAASGGFVITTELELAAGAHTITARLLSGTGEAKSAVFTSTRKRIDLLAHDFADETEGSLYTTYTEGDGSLSSSGGRITASGFSNGYYENNGIRLDITDIIRQTEGQSLYASADVEVTWDGTARLFIETVSPDGETERIVIAESGDFSNNCVSLTGSCDPVTLEEGGRAYLCITQHSGMAYFDNIMLWYYPEAMKLFTHTFNSEKAAQAAMYEPYEDGVGTVEGGSGTVLKYDKGSASGGTAGIKLDLTEKFGVDDTMSGSVFGASSFIKPGYSWSGGNSVEMFFEITGESGTKRVPLCTADTEMFAETTELFDSETLSSLGENWLAKPLSGEAALDIADGDHVYLCITTDNNPVWYDDITVYRQPGAAEPDSDEPDPDEPEITVSGIRYREDGTPYVTVTNTGSADVDIDIFTASYDETGALAGAAVTAAKVTADGKAAEIEFDADAGDRVFVWDKQMRPLSGIMTAE